MYLGWPICASVIRHKALRGEEVLTQRPSCTTARKLGVRNQPGRSAVHAIALKVSATMAGVVIPGLVAGLIYVVVAFATGAPVVTSTVGGIVVAAIAVAIGLIIRAVYERRGAGPHL